LIFYAHNIKDQKNLKFKDNKMNEGTIEQIEAGILKSFVAGNLVFASKW